MPGHIVRQEKNGWVNYGMLNHFEIMEWMADYIEVNMPDRNDRIALVAVDHKMNPNTFRVDFHIGFLDANMAMAFRLRWT